MIGLSKYMSLFDIIIHFDTPKKCKDALAQSRWAAGKMLIIPQVCRGIEIILFIFSYNFEFLVVYIKGIIINIIKNVYFNLI